MTRKTVHDYFAALSAGQDWPSFLAEGLTFESHATPAKHVTGRDAFIESTRGFYSMIERVELRQLFADGHRACALASYVLRPPQGEAFTCEVAEFFTVRDGRIEAFEIYFDSAAFSRVPSRPSHST